MYRVKLSWWPLPNGPKVFTCEEAKASRSDAGGQAGQGGHPPPRHPWQGASPPFPSAVPFPRQATDAGQEENFWLLFSSVPEREERKQTNTKKANKRDFSTNFSRLRFTGKQRAQPVGPRSHAASPARGSGLQERPPAPPPPAPRAGTGARSRMRSPRDGHPTRSLPVTSAARGGGGRPGRAHPGHQRALQEQLHELRHRHVHAEPRPRRTKRLGQPAAGAGDKGGARAHGARLRPRPPGASERVGARRGGRGDAVPPWPPGALRSLAEPSRAQRGGGARGEWGGERGGATARGGPSARAGAACARRPGRGAGPGGRGARYYPLAAGSRTGASALLSPGFLPSRSSFRMQAVWPPHPWAPLLWLYPSSTIAPRGGEPAPAAGRRRVPQ